MNCEFISILSSRPFLAQIRCDGSARDFFPAYTRPEAICKERMPKLWATPREIDPFLPTSCLGRNPACAPARGLLVADSEAAGSLRPYMASASPADPIAMGLSLTVARLELAVALVGEE